MTMWGPTPPAPEPVYSVQGPWDPPAPPQRAGMPALVAMILIGVLVAAGFGVWYLERDEPIEWDPELESLVRFVEKERGLEFEHAVPVDYFSDEEWDEEISSGGSAALTDEETDEIENALAYLRALGLAEGDIDLVGQIDEYSLAGILALYDFDSHRIKIHAERDDDLPVDVRGTLVHELTHALQDQHFDIASMYEASDPNSFAVQALVEGDAVNVESAWVETLSPDEQDDYYAVAEEGVDSIDDIELPVAFQIQFGAPYALGPSLAYMLQSTRPDRLDDAFRDSPTSDEHVFDPVTYLEGDLPREVKTPGIPDRADELDSGSLGSLAWYVLLSERIDAHRALEAADGWGGDAYVQYRDGDQVCLRVRYIGDTDAETKDLRAALSEWVDTLPSDFAGVAIDGKYLEFQSCDPGSGETLETGKSLDAFALPVSRGQLESFAIGDGASTDEARCFANTIIDQSTVAQLNDFEDPRWEDDAWLSRVEEIRDDCSDF